MVEKIYKTTPDTGDSLKSSVLKKINIFLLDSKEIKDNFKFREKLNEFISGLSDQEKEIILQSELDTEESGSPLTFSALNEVCKTVVQTRDGHEDNIDLSLRMDEKTDEWCAVFMRRNYYADKNSRMTELNYSFNKNPEGAIIDANIKAILEKKYRGTLCDNEVKQ
ncbi:MAG: hypothetical protein PHT51_00545 [Patescibacteria group bacterium]|nr:hypothetical protein [Patescibacteria group bacterium]MDD4610740.1 hypothetical protein [Patescibacteria group bacterium]